MDGWMDENTNYSFLSLCVCMCSDFYLLLTEGS